MAVLISERPYDCALSTVVLKATETCNMACPYCFMFRGQDRSWQKKPSTMPNDVMASVARRLRDYIDSSLTTELEVIIHGGEPLLLGKAGIRKALDDLCALPRVSVSLQTNATLLDEGFLDIFRDYPVKIGSSLDGYPEIQDSVRTLAGEPSYDLIVRGLGLLRALGTDRFRGLLAVINLEGDARRVYRHFRSLGISRMDFLFPLRNHAHPYGYSMARTDYFRWLLPIWETYYQDDDDSVSVRLFDSIIELLVGSEGPMSAVEGSAVDMLTIDTDGSIQLIDDLRICGDGYVELGLNVAGNDIVEFFEHPRVKRLYEAEQCLPKRCCECRYLAVCGSGGHAFRYMRDDEYNMPSIYCSDIYALCQCIESAIYE